MDAELIDRLLTDPGLGQAASEVADEISATLPEARRPRAENRRPRLTCRGAHRGVH